MPANPTLQRVLRAVRAAVPQHPPTTVVAVDGPAGSGKTTLAGRLATLLSAPLLHMDDLYPGWDGLADGPVNLTRWVLEPLAAGRQARYRRYDWNSGAFAEWHDVPPAPVLIVEGVGSGGAAAADHLDLLLWIEAPERVRHTRGIERDGEAFAPHWRRWADAEQRMFAADRTRERADLLFDGTAPIT